MLRIDSIDHVVLTVRDIDRTCEFYARVLGMDVVTFGEGRKALAFGSQKINLHPHGREYVPHAGVPTPGSIDVCFITRTPLVEVMAHLAALGVSLVEGPVDRAGATGPLKSVYIRDPDDNLVEIANLVGA